MPFDLIKDLYETGYDHSFVYEKRLEEYGLNIIPDQRPGTAKF